jgi:hypothetical protein
MNSWFILRDSVPWKVKEWLGEIDGNIEQKKKGKQAMSEYSGSSIRQAPVLLMWVVPQPAEQHQELGASPSRGPPPRVKIRFVA